MTGSKECIGMLNLSFAKNKHSKTYIEHSYARYPLHHSPLIYRHANVPSMGTLYTQNITGGICSEDINHINIKVKERSTVHITNTSATKIHRMESSGARDNVEIELCDHAYVEYKPEPLIPFAGSSYYQHTLVNLKNTSTFIASECIYPGRLSRDECFEYVNLSLTTKIMCDNKLVCTSALSLNPKNRNLKTNGLFGRYNYAYTTYIIAPWCNYELILHSLNLNTQNNDDSLSAIGVLPSNIGIYVRILSLTPTGLRSMIDVVYKRIHCVMTKIAGIQKQTI